MRVDLFKEGQELDVSMTCRAAAEHLPTGDIQSREESKGAVPNIL